MTQFGTLEDINHLALAC